MAKEKQPSLVETSDTHDNVQEIAEYLELNVGPVADSHKKILAELVQRYGAAAVALTVVSEMSQLDMVTALLQQTKDVLKRRKRP